MTLCVGLTGGIGCGKSTVADMFAKLGAGIIDTDEIAHRLTQAEGTAIPEIRSEFGDEYIKFDGALDRDKMRGLIFSDVAAKKRLEKILHPLILEQAKVQLQHLRASPYIIIVVPLLPGSPAFQRLVQRILVVDCTEENQVARVAKRSPMDEAEVRSVIAQQTPRSERLKLSDDLIRNDAGMDSLATQVAALHERYLEGD
jgi:dephospho-CoA kinase